MGEGLADEGLAGEWPFAVVLGALFLVAAARGGATYALARGLRGLAAQRSRLLERPGVGRAERLVGRWGAPAVSLCFLTVGVQTAVNAAAGSLRMPLRRYLPALAVGAALWATLYATVGLAVVRAFWGGTWGRAALVALVALLALGVLAARLHRRANRPRGGPRDEPSRSR